MDILWKYVLNCHEKGPKQGFISLMQNMSFFFISRWNNDMDVFSLNFSTQNKTETH